MGRMSSLQTLEGRLNAFDAAERSRALAALLRDHAGALRPAGTNVNMHCHSFFSYNARGFSPSRIAWETGKAGLYAAGLCDFDVLDGLEEFHDAGLRTRQRTTVNVETRAYLKEYAGVDINSPGEQGVTYIMGAGFGCRPAADTPQGREMDGYKQRARRRNEALVLRVNAALPAIAVDYQHDVLPLTPAGGATERHIVLAYIRKSRDVFEHPDKDARFWADVLRKPFEEIVELLADQPAMEEAVRARLVKRGGIGYEAPSAGTFPPVEEFTAWVRACDAIPMTTWLDGTSGGEKDARALLECMRDKGAVALNIIPDRNWNIGDAAARDLKRGKLAEIVAVADAMRQPINIGTEMNRLGLPFVDDLDGEALRPHREVFLRGARIMVGHALLLRYAGFSYAGDKARREFPELEARNAFFEAVGGLPPLDVAGARRLEDLGAEKAYASFRDVARKESA